MRPIHAVYRSSFSLGNALIFRQELELLGAHVIVHFEKPIPAYFYELFQSEISFELTQDPAPRCDWILEGESNASLKRIAGVPHLKWSKKALGEAMPYKDAYICHLKQVGTSPEESNATLQNWEAFFQETSCPFIQIGKEAPVRGARHAESLGLSLSAQLALCSIAKGFLGMASGPSTAALLSPTPYVILKHPKHHPEEMERELGSADHFPFATPLQKIWRKEDDLPTLHEALSWIQRSPSSFPITTTADI